MEDRVRAGLNRPPREADELIAREMRSFAFVTSGGFTLIFCLAPLVLKHRLHVWPLGLSFVLIAFALTWGLMVMIGSFSQTRTKSR